MIENNCPGLHMPKVDALINAEVLLPQGKNANNNDVSNLVQAKVKRHFCDGEGNIVGNTDTRPQLYILMYEVKSSNGEVRPYSMNVKVENIWSQVDVEGQRYLIFKSMIDHHLEENIAVGKEDMHVSE